jgi:hypothetical protein
MQKQILNPETRKRVIFFHILRAMINIARDATESKKERKIFKLFRTGTLPDWIQRRSVGRRLRRK